MRCSLLLTACVACAACFSLLVAAHPSGGTSATATTTVGQEGDDLPPDTFRQLAQALYQSSEGVRQSGSMRVRSPREDTLKKKLFYDQDVTCNDGSVAGYYIRRNNNSKKWVVFLEGGWICHDEPSCRERAVLESPRMSSARWPSARAIGGILSADPTENPHLSDANHVFVPYCSSDSWSGTRRGRKGELSFLGSAILRQVIAELSSFENLLHADELYLSGSSAGAIGVLVNLDGVSDALTPAGVSVKGIVDSGWFLDDHGCGSHDDGSFPSSSRCKFIRDLKVGMEMWRAKVPESCRREFADQPWKCYIGYRMYPLIKSPLFIFQWQFDTFQLYADSMSFASQTSTNALSRSDRMSAMSADLKRSLSDVTAVFSPACIAHEVLTRSTWAQVTVQQVTLPDAIQCWADSLKGNEIPKSVGATLQDVLGSLGVAPDLPVRDQSVDDTAPVSRFHIRTAPMFSHEGKRYKVGSNYLKSLDLDTERNRIGGDDEVRRRGNKKGHRDNVIKNNRTGNRHKNGRRKRGRSKKGRNRVRQLKHRTVCHPESNSCQEDSKMQGRNNKDMVRSLDRRSSRKEREKRRRRKRGRKNRRLRKNKKRGGKNEEEARRRKEERRQRRREKRRKRKERQRKKQREQMEKLTKDISAMVSQRRQKRNLDHLPPSQCASSVRAGGGSLRLVDSCRFPHCNPSCPRMRNPEDGTEIGLLAMLEAYGMNKVSMAAAMDVDVAALDDMDREVLLSKLNASANRR